MSSIGSSGRDSSGRDPEADNARSERAFPFFSILVGFQVDEEGMTTVAASLISLPSAKAASAAVVAAAMADALSRLNCFLSARRRAIISSAIESVGYTS